MERERLGVGEKLRHRGRTVRTHISVEIAIEWLEEKGGLSFARGIG